jgi:hypothetical protein
MCFGKKTKIIHASEQIPSLPLNPLWAQDGQSSRLNRELFVFRPRDLLIYQRGVHPCHSCLATHIALLKAADLLDVTGSHLTTKPVVTSWLHTDPTDQIQQMLTILHSPIWEDTLTQFRWQKTIPIDYTAYIQQTLQRQQTNPPLQPEPAHWHKPPADKVWQLHLPTTLPLWQQFDLRQLGHWLPGQPLTCTPHSIAQAVQRGYGITFIQWLLEHALHTPLSRTQQKQLHQWNRHNQTYQLPPVILLSTTHPEHLSQILRRKRLRTAVHQQISPRHAIVTQEMAPNLEKWLTKQNYTLHQPTASTNEPPYQSPAAQQWLHARILIGLSQIIPLPFPPPHAVIERLGQQLPANEQTQLEQLAQKTLQNITPALRGRDTFFPARQSPAPQTIALIRQAICNETRISQIFPRTAP